MTPDRHLGYVSFTVFNDYMQDFTPTVSLSLCLYICSAAWIDKCRPDILISESTYATTIRDSKRCRERDFLKKVHEIIERGGKVIFRDSGILYFGMFIERKFGFLQIWAFSSFQVLIPVFALGRAQELCILLETFWWVFFF